MRANNKTLALYNHLREDAGMVSGHALHLFGTDVCMHSSIYLQASFPAQPAWQQPKARRTVTPEPVHTYIACDYNMSSVIHSSLGFARAELI